MYEQVYAVINNLRYYDEPPYKHLYSLLRDDLHKHGYHEADPFDWEPLNTDNRIIHSAKTV